MAKQTKHEKKPTTTKGREAEQLACRLLERKGFRILSRNYRCRAGEIDIVAEAEEQLIFVEVRSVGPAAVYLPEETIDTDKQRRLSRAALAYIQAFGLDDRPARFDVVAVEMGPGPAEVRHLPDAFEFSGS